MDLSGHVRPFLLFSMKGEQMTKKEFIAGLAQVMLNPQFNGALHHHRKRKTPSITPVDFADLVVSSWLVPLFQNCDLFKETVLRQAGVPWKSGALTIFENSLIAFGYLEIIKTGHINRGVTLVYRSEEVLKPFNMFKSSKYPGLSIIPLNTLAGIMRGLSEAMRKRYTSSGQQALLNSPPKINMELLV